MDALARAAAIRYSWHQAAAMRAGGPLRTLPASE